MKASIEKMLIDLRHQMRTMFPTGLRLATSATDRQKLLVSITQDYVRHLGDSIRGEYRDRIMVRNADLRMYTLVMKKFVQFQGTVSAFSLIRIASIMPHNPWIFASDQRNSSSIQ